jgi:putative transposase
MLLRFQKAALRGNYETGNQAFSKRLRFLTIREQIVALLRQIEVELANHKSIGQACKEAGITQQTYYRWRKEYGGLKLEQARRLKELEKENSRLRRLVTELSLEKLVLKDVAEGNF